MKNSEIPADEQEQFKKDMDHHLEESVHCLETEDDWICRIHKDFVDRVTATEVPLWMAEIYGRIAFKEPIPQESLT